MLREITVHTGLALVSFSASLSSLELSSLKSALGGRGAKLKKTTNQTNLKKQQIKHTNKLI